MNQSDSPYDDFDLATDLGNHRYFYSEPTEGFCGFPWNAKEWEIDLGTPTDAKECSVKETLARFASHKGTWIVDKNQFERITINKFDRHSAR
jgi:hypothetical protein